MKLPAVEVKTLEKVPTWVSIASGRSRGVIATGADGAEPDLLTLASSSISDNRRRAELIARTQSSISSCDDALARNVRLAVTIPNEKECFFTVTGATACTDLRSRTRFNEYSYPSAPFHLPRMSLPGRPCSTPACWSLTQTTFASTPFVNSAVHSDWVSSPFSSPASS